MVTLLTTFCLHFSAFISVPCYGEKGRYWQVTVWEPYFCRLKRPFKWWFFRTSSIKSVSRIPILILLFYYSNTILVLTVYLTHFQRVHYQLPLGSIPTFFQILFARWCNMMDNVSFLRVIIRLALIFREFASKLVYWQWTCNSFGSRVKFHKHFPSWACTSSSSATDRMKLSSMILRSHDLSDRLKKSWLI